LSDGDNKNGQWVCRGRRNRPSLGIQPTEFDEYNGISSHLMRGSSATAVLLGADIYMNRTFDTWTVACVRGVDRSMVDGRARRIFETNPVRVTHQRQVWGNLQSAKKGYGVSLKIADDEGRSSPALRDSVEVASNGSASPPTLGAVTGDGPTAVLAMTTAGAVLPLSPPVRVGVSLIIPAKNEARNLPWVLERVPGCVDEVILVDGSSRDATTAMAEYCRPDIRIVRQVGHGKGEALRAGFEVSSGEIVIMIDADGSMSPEEIPQYLWYLEHGYDFVKGSRFVAGGGSLDLTALRKIGNKSLLLLVNVMYGSHVTDLCYGFCAFRRRWLDCLALTTPGFEIETEMTIRALQAGLRITEVPSLELCRRSGRSNLRSFRDGLRIMRTIFRIRGGLAPSLDEPIAAIGVLPR
jgi:hypothetical protein